MASENVIRGSIIIVGYRPSIYTFSPLSLIPPSGFIVFLEWLQTSLKKLDWCFLSNIDPNRKSWFFHFIQLFAIIVFGCISSEGWRYDRQKKRETCLFNDNGNVCNYGVGIGVIAFLASIGFLAGEYLFEQMSSVKTRKHYVLADLGFSGKMFCLRIK